VRLSPADRTASLSARFGLAQNHEVGIAGLYGNFVLGMTVGQSPLVRELPALDGLCEGGRRFGLVGLHAFLVRLEEVVHGEAAIGEDGRLERPAHVKPNKARAEALRQVRRHTQPMSHRIASVAVNENGLVAHRRPPVRDMCATSSGRRD
jgi:hypothetical protein